MTNRFTSLLFLAAAALLTGHARAQEPVSPNLSVGLVGDQPLAPAADQPQAPEGVQLAPPPRLSPEMSRVLGLGPDGLRRQPLQDLFAGQERLPPADRLFARPEQDFSASFGPPFMPNRYTPAPSIADQDFSDRNGVALGRAMGPTEWRANEGALWLGGRGSAGRGLVLGYSWNKSGLDTEGAVLAFRWDWKNKPQPGGAN